MRILVVEDEIKIANFIKKGLKEEGYSVDVANDGQQGDYLSSINDYDVVLLDVMLPKMDGILLCQKLRNNKVLAKIIMLTAKSDIDDKVAGLNAGADDYIAKPFAFEELLARIRAHTRNLTQIKSTQLKVSTLTVDLLSHKVMRDNTEIILTNKEFALLEYLMRHAGSVITRTTILEHVWDMHFDSDTNIVDVHVNNLRRKIDRDFEKKLIHTYRGRGYAIRP